MNVRIVPRGQPNRTDTYTSVDLVLCDGEAYRLYSALPWMTARALAAGHFHVGLLTPPLAGRDCITLPMADVAEILLDEDGAVS